MDRPESPVQQTKPRSGSLTTTLKDIFTTFPSQFRRQDTTLQDRARLVANITSKDIKGAKRCGGGGFGVVFVLKHRSLGKIALRHLYVSGSAEQVATLKRRALREGETWEDLEHPNVLPFLGVLETAGELYLVSPHVKNGSLDDYLRGFPNADRPRLLKEAAAAIAYLHRSNIIHGDIKAANILISNDIHVLLCDFGWAGSVETTTSVGLQVSGTVAWKSPELLDNQRKTFESDVWAFGMTIYEVLSGRIPFDMHPPTAVMHAIVTKDERPPTIPTHSPGGVSYDYVWEAAEGCWKRDPSERQSMDQANASLDITQTLPLQAAHPITEISKDTGSVSAILDTTSDMSTVELEPHGSSHPGGGPLLHQLSPTGPANLPIRSSYIGDLQQSEAGEYSTSTDRIASVPQPPPSPSSSSSTWNAREAQLGRDLQYPKPWRGLLKKRGGRVIDCGVKILEDSEKVRENSTLQKFKSRLQSVKTSAIEPNPVPAAAVDGTSSDEWESCVLAATPQNDFLALPALSGAYPDVAQLTSTRRAPDLLGASNHPENQPTGSHMFSNRVFPLKVTDYGFKDGDKRRTIVKIIDLDNPTPLPPPAPGGFIRPLDAEEIARLDGEGGGNVTPVADAIHAPGFVKGWYRALHSFKAEGANEIPLTAGEIYECNSRGGTPGDGWLIVTQLVGRRLTYGLAPERYLQFVGKT